MNEGSDLPTSHYSQTPGMPKSDETMKKYPRNVKNLFEISPQYKKKINLKEEFLSKDANLKSILSSQKKVHFTFFVTILLL